MAVLTNSKGDFHFPEVHPGTYKLRAEMGADRSAEFPLTLGLKDPGTIDLTLAREGADKTLSVAPQFFDEPTFVIAGVTDTTSLGGHGSDAVVRNREAMAKATVSLSNPYASDRADSKTPAAEQRLREKANQNPDDFDANYQLGKLLVDQAKPAEAIRFLERAAHANPEHYENSYELTVAYAASGNYESAQTRLRALLAHHNLAEVHHLLADVDERSGNSLESVHEYQRAAELNPSEPYFFDWGTELLLHHAPEPAMEVFGKGNQLFPNSVRMMIGFAIALYAHGSSEAAVARICAASDLDPSDPDPYLFLGRLQSADNAPSDQVIGKLARFAKLRPENAEANYYYAVSLWKRRNASDPDDMPQVQSLLEKAVKLDPALAPADLQLGILYAVRGDFPKAIASYRRAIQIDPQLEEAHYRLAQLYRQRGESEQAQSESQVAQKLAKDSAQQVDRQRHDLQQFVYTLRGPVSNPKPN